MGELSRMKKYEDLRNKLQEVDESISTKELSRFEKRLNELDANNFSVSNQIANDNHSALHARQNEFTSSLPLDKATNENKQSFYDEYINEVKQYNLEQGNAISTNTSVNVLNQIKGEMNNQNSQKPYHSNFKRPENTTSVPQFANNQSFSSDYLDMQSNTEQMAVIDDSPFVEDSHTMSKDDIMAEVQSLVNGNLKDSYSPMGTDTFQRHISADNRSAQQQILNETTQMRAQLDDYEDNLSEVNGKVHEVLRLSNIILTVFIIFLVVALIIFIYLLILSRGV